MKISSALILVLLASTLLVSAQNSINPTLRTAGLKKSTEAITVDGILNEQAWKDASVLDSFFQQFPFDSSFARTKTEVRITYDEKHLHIAAICYIDSGSKSVIRSLRRDFDPALSDNFRVVIDPFNDRNNGFVFGVNPLNSQYEGIIANGGTFGASPEWDNKWFSAVHREATSWTVEMAIPFTSFRFTPGNTEWHINFIRQNLSINELSVWNFIPRNFNSNSLAFAGNLLWDEPAPKAGRNLAIIPYVATEANQTYGAQAGKNSQVSLGGDAKVGLSSSLNLDLTVRPDFSQADVDRQVTNLTRFSIFFPERRQFFLENSDLFAQFGFSKIRPFFSRQIGLDQGNRIPIQYGVRLSGKVDRNWRVGLLNMQTLGDTALKSPQENFTVACFQRQLKGRSYLGGIFVNRQSGNLSDMQSTYNRVAGLDYRLASKNGRWNGIVFFHKSFTSETKKGDDYAHASFLRYDDANWSLMWNHEYVGTNYRASTGFVPRQEQFNSLTNEINRLSYWRLEPEITRRWYPKSRLVNNVEHGLYASWYADSSLRTTEGVYIFSNQVNFQNTAYAGINFTSYYTRLLFPIDITYTGANPLQVSSYTYADWSVFGRSDIRRLFTSSVVFSKGSFYTGKKTTLQLDINYRWQPWGTFGIRYTGDDLNLPVTTTQGESSTFRKTLNLIGPSADLSFSRRLFFSAIVQLSTQTDNLSIYARLQWRFRPMSDLFIVYTDNYTANGILPKNKAIVIKLAWWLNT